MKSGKISCLPINNIIESIALEETALSHILNAEGEKIQKALEKATSIDELLRVNGSVQCTITDITHLECILYDKLKLAINADCGGCPPIINKGLVGVFVYSCKTKFPLSNVSVKVYDQSSTLVGSGVTDANGIYFLGNLNNGVYTVVVKEITTGKEQSFTATIDETQKIVFKQICFESQTISGISLYVYECQKKIPLSNILVKLFDSSNNLIEQKTTDETGKYIKLGLPHDIYKLQMTNLTTSEVKEQFAEINENNKYVEKQECFSNATLLGVITVKTTICANCKPLAGIKVTITKGANVVDYGVTDANGQFKSQLLPLETYKVILFDTLTQVEQVRTVTLTQNNPNVSIEVCFTRCYNDYVNIKGIVTDCYGNRLCNALVTANGLDKRQTRTNDCGQYEINNLKVCNQFTVYAECKNQRSSVYVENNPVNKNYVCNIKIKLHSYSFGLSI
ncbi:MAG: carboxypeptidase-like regulatory domain-containing protein [Clostridia bacterium]